MYVLYIKEEEIVVYTRFKDKNMLVLYKFLFLI